MDTGLRLKLAEQVEKFHYGECARDAYGDEGDGYDFGKLVDLLVEAGWTPPSEVGAR
jgi:hypothetical protein